MVCGNGNGTVYDTEITSERIEQVHRFKTRDVWLIIETRRMLSVKQSNGEEESC